METVWKRIRTLISGLLCATVVSTSPAVAAAAPAMSAGTERLSSFGTTERIPGPCTRATPVIFVHGFLMDGDNSFVELQNAAARRGWCTYSFTYGAVDKRLPVAGFGSQAQGARELAVAVERARAETGADTVHLITHSKGAAVAAEYLRGNPHAATRVVNLGGVAATLPGAEPVPAPRPGIRYLNIASRYDLIVPNWASLPRCETCTNVLIQRPVGHVGLLYDRAVAARALNFLDS